MAGHELNYDTIAVSRPKPAGTGAAMYVVSLCCTCGSRFQGAGASYVEASQKLHAAFAAHQQETQRRVELVKV